MYSRGRAKHKPNIQENLENYTRGMIFQRENTAPDIKICENITQERYLSGMKLHREIKTTKVITGLGILQENIVYIHTIPVCIIFL